jgi:hypothetical protein
MENCSVPGGRFRIGPLAKITLDKLYTIVMDQNRVYQNRKIFQVFSKTT